jgi:hypothetical protein
VIFESRRPRAAATPDMASRRASASHRPSMAKQAMTTLLVPTAPTQYQEIGLVT